MPGAVALPEQFRGFAASVARDGCATYDAICRSVADDAGILGLLSQAPPAQRRPNLLLAAVHFLLLGGSAHPLGTHYDTVAAYTGREATAPVGVVADQFRDFCLTHRAALLALIATGSTQTNEVGRCAALLPALAHIAAPTGPEPMGLLDLGTSAGLNLLFDRYAYCYRQREGGAVAMAGDPSSAVGLDCTVRGELASLPPLEPPVLPDRAGLDRAPIDPRSDDGARWLLACLWPDNLARFGRLRAALDIARRDPLRPALHTGDIVDRLEEVAATVAPGRPLVVFHSWVAAYLTEARQRELVEAVRALGAVRPVHYLYAESPVETPGLPTPPAPEVHATSHLATALVHLPPRGEGGTGGGSAGRGAGRAADPAAVRLADLHPHGRWLRWWVTPDPGPRGRRGERAPAPRPR
ncbi:MAG: DUF2332 domain-containing protein [Acidimicrobiales bacterium]